MNNKRRGMAIIFTALVLVTMTMPATFIGTSNRELHVLDSFEAAETDLVVNVRKFNYQQEFNDDDFEFQVLNYTFPVLGANVSLFFASNESLYDSATTDGSGYAVFLDVPLGVYNWNVTWDEAPDIVESGVIESDGPEVIVDWEIGNLDGQNDDDDLYAEITDVSGDPAEGLNFSIHHRTNNSVYVQFLLGPDGVANVSNIPIGNYTWKVTIPFGEYTGYVAAQENFTADGTTIHAHTIIAPFAGDLSYYDLQVYVYYETTLEPVSDAIANVTYYNGTVISVKTTSDNGTVLFLDLPVAFINWTITHLDEVISIGYKNLTDVSADIRAPIITSPGDQEFHYESENITVTWHLEDEYPHSIILYLDGVIEETIDWVNATYQYTFNVTGFDLGIYELRLVALDQNENTAEDIITVRIYEDIPPVISGSADVGFYYTETGYSLSWNVTEENPDKYVIQRNGTDLRTGAINPLNPVITISLDGLSIGIHVYTLIANDTSGNTAHDNVTVTVRRDDVPPVIMYEPSTVLYSLGELNILRNWTATDQFKDYYVIKVNGFVVVNEKWASENIEFDFAGLSQGEHWVELTVYDLGGNSASSAVLVVVGLPFVTSVLLVMGGSIGLVVVAYFAVWYMRRRQ